MCIRDSFIRITNMQACIASLWYGSLYLSSTIRRVDIGLAATILYGTSNFGEPGDKVCSAPETVVTLISALGLTRITSEALKLFIISRALPGHTAKTSEFSGKDNGCRKS